MVTTSDIAKQLITDVGGNPNNKLMVRAIEVWVAGESGTHILSNNPWNLRPGTDYTACNSGADSSNFTVFCTWQDGVKATAQRLSHNDYRGYRPVYDAIQQGKPLAFFTALARSKWSSDHYGGGSKLISAFKGTANYNRVVSFGSRAAPHEDSRPPTTTYLSGFGGLVNIPQGQMISIQIVDQMMADLTAANWFGSGPGATISAGATRIVLLEEVGHPWNKATQDDIAAKMKIASAYVAGKTSPQAIIGDAAGAAGDALGIGKLADTVTQVATYALAVGLIVVGLFIYTKKDEGLSVVPVPIP
jgi:hypothetical protein